jgi:VIT1/CCC1 family predicted Fe2+/Mn2+ transporter
MRALILFAGAALSLTSCRNNDQVDNTMNVDENLATENIVSNDTTAIDAVTGEAANMAADVDYSNLLDDNAAADSNASATRNTSGSRRVEPASNAAAEATGDNAL